MQCHGGLKGPLRRIIRELGNEAWLHTRKESSYRLPYSHPHSLPERCKAPHERRLDSPSPRRPQPRSLSRLNGRSSRPYTTQTSPPAESSRNEEAHEQGQIDSHDTPTPTPSGFNAFGEDVGDGQTSNGTTIRSLTSPAVKDTQDFSPRYHATVRRVHVSQAKGRLSAYQSQKDRHDYAGEDNWRVALHMLDENTPAGHVAYRKRLETITIPGGGLARFRGNAGASIREIMEHTGCHVQLARGTHSSSVDGAFSSLDLLGFSRQISQAITLLRSGQYLDLVPAEEVARANASSNLANTDFERKTRSDEDMRIASLSTSEADHLQDYGSLDEGDIEHLESELDGEEDSSQSVTTPIRSIWAEDRTRRYDMYNAFDDRQASLSTPLEISAYIADLCQSIPRQAHKTTYKTTMPFSQRRHVQIVTEKLQNMFAVPHMVHMVTPAAVDRTIRFLTRHSNFAAFRDVLRNLEDEGYKLTTSNWNCCLAAAAKVGDVHNYRYTLKVMLRSDLKPNPVTWATLHDLMCRRFPLEAGFVVETMRKKGLLNDFSAAKQVAQNSIANDLKAHLALRGHLTTFFRLYDNRFRSSYGLENFNWLSVDALNRMTHVFFSLGRTHDAFAVLEEFRRRNGGERALETATLNTFLTSSLRDMDAASAVATLQHFRIGHPGALVPDSVTYSILFTIAWRQRYFNMLRVVWRYACMSGHIGYSMRHRIKKNLNFFLGEKSVDGEGKMVREHVWRAFASKFAVGISGGSRRAGEDADTQGLEPLEVQLLRSISMKTRLRKVLTYDYDAVGVSRPVRPLAEMLQDAWRKDREWKERGLGEAKGYNEGIFEEMLREGIEVPVEAGDGMLEVRKWEVPALLRRSVDKDEEEKKEEVAKGYVPFG